MLLTVTAVFSVIVALPLPVPAQPLPSETEPTVYVPAAADIVYVEDVILDTGLEPDAEPYVNAYGAVPVKAMLTVPVEPGHTVALPLIVAVAPLFTVATTAVLGVEVHPLPVAST